MKLFFKFNSKKNYVSGKLDVYHINFKPNTYIIDIWRISVYLILG